MYIVVGLFVVMASVFGSYVLGGGSLGPLYQPLELVAIGGAALGSFIAANNRKAIVGTFKAISKLKLSTSYNEKTYIDLMVLMYTILTKSRKEGLMAIEKDIDDPANSPIFSQYPKILKDTLVMTFISDYFKLLLTGNMDAHEIDEIMERNVETYEHEANLPSDTLSKVADALPAFGIVAAVMGVVKALTYADASPQEIGEMIAHALVGTFLGILLAYGVFAPLASRVSRQVSEQIKMLNFLRTIIVNSLNGYQPNVAVEFGRLVLDVVERPTATELEAILRESKKGGAANADAGSKR